MENVLSYIPLRTNVNKDKKAKKKDSECDGRFVYVSRSQFVEEMGKTNRQAAVIYTALFRDRTENFLKGKKSCFEKFNY